MMFHVEARTDPWPDGEPLASRDVQGTRATARCIAQELLRGVTDARLADVRLRWTLIDQYTRRRTTGGIRHLYSAPMRARRAS